MCLTMSCIGISADFKRTAATFLFASTILVLIAATALAQQVAVAQLDGYVTDPSGQVIVGAQVKLIEVDRQHLHEGVTDMTGHYAFPGLPPRSYQLDVSSPGFKTYVQKGIVLDAGTNRTQAVTMEVGATTAFR